jgi:hypothetical protein
MEKWTRETIRELRAALHTGPPSVAFEPLGRHPVADTAHTIAAWLIAQLRDDTDGARAIAIELVSELDGRMAPGDSDLATRLRHALADEEPAELRRIPVELDMLSYTMESGLDGYTTGHCLNIETGEVLSDDPEGIEGIPLPDDWDDDDRWLELWPTDSREGWQDMADFVDTVTDPDLARRLADAIRGRGAFGRFKNIVYQTEEGHRCSRRNDSWDGRGAGWPSAGFAPTEDHRGRPGRLRFYTAERCISAPFLR